VYLELDEYFRGNFISYKTYIRNELDQTSIYFPTLLQITEPTEEVYKLDFPQTDS